ncbi:MAG: phosphoribosyltransferase family protein [Actinomycetes bacterium]|jgi:putative phosphoribosyl transferase
MRFADRRRAGEELARAVAAQSPRDPVVLALPRGGVPVGDEVALALGCPLDVLLVRKLGVPGHPELAMGALAEGGITVWNEELIAMLGITDGQRAVAVEREAAMLARQAEAFRPEGAARVDPRGRTALVVDDGLATGATALAAVDALKTEGAAEVWVCAPVGPPDTVAAMGEVADRVVVVHTPRHFGAVGAWYADFDQVGDAEVEAILERARLRFTPPSREES